MVPVELNDENLQVGILILIHVLLHRHEQKLTEASFVANHSFIKNRAILLFLKESIMLHQLGRVACSFTFTLFRELGCSLRESK